MLCIVNGHLGGHLETVFLGLTSKLLSASPSNKRSRDKLYTWWFFLFQSWMVKYVQEGWVKCSQAGCWIESQHLQLLYRPDLRPWLWVAKPKKNLSTLQPLIRSKNEDTNKKTTLLQITLCGQISPITKEENTPLSPIICIHCLQLDLFWFFFYPAQACSYWLFTLQLNRSLFKFHWLLNAKSCISCGILVSGIRARGVILEHMENMEMFSCSPT